MSTIKTVTTSFRPNANLVKILGEQLISDPVVGLLELVKNGHDADAEPVFGSGGASRIGWKRNFCTGRHGEDVPRGLTAPPKASFPAVR